MTSSDLKSEVLNGPQRRRRRVAAEKLVIVAETYEPGVTVSLVARRNGIQPNQLFAWRRLATQEALAATRPEEPVVPASDIARYRGRSASCSGCSPRRRWRRIFSSGLPMSAGPKKHPLRMLSWAREVPDEDRVRGAGRGAVQHRGQDHGTSRQAPGRPPPPDADLLARSKQ